MRKKANAMISKCHEPTFYLQWDKKHIQCLNRESVAKRVILSLIAASNFVSKLEVKVMQETSRETFCN